jgi:hypothetical protein
VLARVDQIAPGQPYDVVVAFRGSRSGRSSDPRMVNYVAFNNGNPDWVTDLDFPRPINSAIHPQYGVHRGFAVAVATMLPTIGAALQAIAAAKAGPPREIHIIGHSLGAGLATCFASAALSAYTASAAGHRPPWFSQGVALWPWDPHHMHVTTFGGPPVAGLDFCHWFNASIPFSFSWRLTLDEVPLEPTRKKFTILTGGQWVRTGHDMPLDFARLMGIPPDPPLKPDAAHSPDNYRMAMEKHLFNYNRTQDGYTSWNNIKSISGIINKYTQEPRKNLAPAQNNWFNLKNGLSLYLMALKDMVADSANTVQRFSPSEKVEITNLINLLTAPITQNVVNGTVKTSLDTLSHQHFYDSEKKLIGRWFALAAAEDGCQWSPPGGWWV